jgi:Ca-activated chloride channel homolog
MNSKFTPTEEQLTAWVLGELDAAEAKQVAEAVNADAKLRAVTDEIQATIEMSEAAFSELHAADVPELSDSQEAEIDAAAGNVVPVNFKKGKITRKKMIEYAVSAAMVTVMAGVTWQGISRSREAARRSSPENDRKQRVLEQQLLMAERAPSTSGASTFQLPFVAPDSPRQLPTLDESRYGNDFARTEENLPESVAISSEQDSYTDGDRIDLNGTGQAAGGRALVLEKEEGKKGKDDQLAVGLVEPSIAPVSSNEPGSMAPKSPSPAMVPGGGPGLVGQSLPEMQQVKAARKSALTAPADSVALGERFRMADVSEQQWRYATPPPVESPGTESYDRFVDNTFKAVRQHPLSTFSIDVDTASYANMRRFLNQGSLPPMDSVRIEEMINYFNYNYAGPTGDDPFAVHLEVGPAPWQPEHRLVRVGLKGHEMASEERPPSNLVFLLDVSGSMSSPNKLPLVKQAIRMLTKQLDERDRVAIAVYAGSSGLVLPSTSVSDERAILDAVERLNAGGSTNGGAGIELAYNVASQNFIKGGVNRVILATDGDFNVGVTNRESLVNLIEQKAKSGVFLSVLGFGMGNLKDATMEKLADKGNGNYAYIDSFKEAKKVLVDDMAGTLVTIAKDVKIQVEFNPANVRAYRLIGYENRALANRDFNDDTKDAGEIGAGHTVTALYEIVPVERVISAGVDPLRYETETKRELSPRSDVDPAASSEMLTVKLRYKLPDGNVSKLLTFHLSDVGRDVNQTSTDFQFASAVAAFGQILRRSPHVNGMDFPDVIRLAEAGMGADLNGYRAEFIDLVRKAQSQWPRPRPTRGPLF